MKSTKATTNSPTQAESFSLDRANLFVEHGLLDEAKLECIQIATSQAASDDKATAYYTLGLIAFDQNKVSTALSTWSNLVKDYPDSKEAKKVTERLKELSQIVGENQRGTLDNLIARSYLKHGDFWSRGKEYKFIIDSSWIPSVEAANKWYDKTIAEFPGTNAAKAAYHAKLRTILGWKSSRRNGLSYGVEESFDKYMPQLIKAFEQYAVAFPDSASLQSFRYQIAQKYWKNKDWDNTRKWLDIIIAESDGSDTFYADLAQRRLKKVEY